MSYNTLNFILRQTQPELKKYLVEKLSEFGYSNLKIGDYIYAKGEIPVMLVAHMDIVHKSPPSEIYFDRIKRVIWSPTGIGGDDRCGVYAILQILSSGLRPHILFTEDEECGAYGAWSASSEIYPNINYMIELDRRGSNDAVFYDCDNKEFQKFILGYGFKHAYGTFSDIATLSPAWDVASVNLSIGYVEEHTHTERINLNHTYATIQKVCNILKGANDIFYKHECVYKYTYTSKKNQYAHGDYGDYDDVIPYRSKGIGTSLATQDYANHAEELAQDQANMYEEMAKNELAERKHRAHVANMSEEEWQIYKREVLRWGQQE